MNKPLTLAQINERFDNINRKFPGNARIGYGVRNYDDYVHSVVLDRYHRNNEIVAVWDGDAFDNMYGREYGERWVFFLDPPTPEDIDAIQWGKENYQ